MWEVVVVVGGVESSRIRIVFSRLPMIDFLLTTARRIATVSTQSHILFFFYSHFPQFSFPPVPVNLPSPPPEDWLHLATLWMDPINGYFFCNPCINLHSAIGLLLWWEHFYRCLQLMVCETSWGKTQQFEEFYIYKKNWTPFDEPRGGSLCRGECWVVVVQRQTSGNLFPQGRTVFLIVEPGAKQSQQVFFSSGSCSDTLQHTWTVAAAASTTGGSGSYLPRARTETEPVEEK